MRQSRILLTLRAVAMLLAIAGAVFVAWPANVTAGDVPPIASLVPAPAVTDSPEADPAPAIVAANIFSASRRPPRVRYRPGGPPDADQTPVGDVQPAGVGPYGAPESGTGSDVHAVPALLGTVVLPGASTAILRLDPSLPGPMVYREGDRAGGYLVERILEQSVTLIGRKGRITLRLRPGDPRP